MRTILSLALAIIFISCTSCANKIEERDQRIASTIMDTIQAASKRLPIGMVDSVQLVSVTELATIDWAKHIIILTQHEISTEKSVIDATNKRMVYDKSRLEKMTDTVEKQLIEKKLQQQEQFLKEQTTELSDHNRKLDSFTTISKSGNREVAGYLVKARLKIKIPGASVLSWSAPQKYLVDKDIIAVIGAN